MYGASTVRWRLIKATKTSSEYSMLLVDCDCWCCRKFVRVMFIDIFSSTVASQLMTDPPLAALASLLLDYLWKFTVLVGRFACIAGYGKWGEGHISLCGLCSPHPLTNLPQEDVDRQTDALRT